MRLGTRKSTMALARTEDIACRLSAAAPELDVEIIKFETVGDTDQTSKLLKYGGKGGAFVAEIRVAVKSGRLHAAMHSPGGGQFSEASRSGPAARPRELGRAVGLEPLHKGAGAGAMRA